jgi:transcriptional/translational regulatory protein YebC/TACO1
MAGHSKWAQIKRKKAVNDNRRGALISKHLTAIQAAVRSGGSGDPAANLALKNAIAAAKTDTVPQDNINRAIERAVGGGEGSQLEEVVYEGYGPAGGGCPRLRPHRQPQPHRPRGAPRVL